MNPLPQQLFSREGVRALDKQAIEVHQIAGFELMQRAGNALFEHIQRTWPQCQTVQILCGVGNNGGDGYILATLLQQAGKQVQVLQLGDTSQLKDDALKAFQQAQQTQVVMQPWQVSISQTADLIVDGLLGTGLNQPVRERWQQAIEWINQASCPVLAIDIPTGICANTGNILGVAVQATSTITFIGFKHGILMGAAKQHCGEIYFDDLQVPAAIYQEVAPSAKRISWQSLKVQLPKRKANAHKGDFGHVLVIGGNKGMIGAPCMAAEAALRVGAGLVTVATRPEHIAALQSTRPEIMSAAVHGPEDLEKLLEKVSVVLLGPGLGQDSWAEQLAQFCFKKVIQPMVIDADGLNLLANTPQQNINWVLTPHPGEAARLLGLASAKDIEQDRFKASGQLVTQYQAITVLKGAGTIIQAKDNLPAICPYGNPGMASAGMGDVLSGVIAGIIAQQVPLGLATEMGVCVHAKAGDIAAQAGQRGLIATDLMPHLRLLMQ